MIFSDACHCSFSVFIGNVTIGTEEAGGNTVKLAAIVTI